MSNRIVTWAAVACLSAYASSAGAVALGEMRALSALGDPLKLRLVLTDLASVNPADVRVTLAPGDDYTRLGLIPPLGAEQWQVTMENSHGLSVLITGALAQKEPNISFLVQVTWPGNISVQQVTAVLLPALPVASSTVMSEPSLPQVIPINDPVAAGAASVNVTVPAANQSATAASDSKSAEVEEIAVAPATARVRGGDTLSQLAKSWKLPRASLAQRQQALAESNPQIFVAGNINQLRRGVIIRYPSASELTLSSAAQASAWLAARQAEARNSASEKLDQPALSAASPKAAPSAANEEVTLTLVSPATTQANAQSVTDESVADQLGELNAEQNTLLAERAALQAELAALEASGSKQDARLKVLDARLAALNTPAAAKTADEAADEGMRSSWVAAIVGVFLALLLVMRRRAAAASAAAANAAKANAAAMPENDYAAFEPLEVLPVPVWAATPAEATAEEVSAAQSAEEEYDFLTDAESAALQTRLDLAQAYIDMQEYSLAKELLHTVMARGNAEQRLHAGSLLDNLA